MDFDVAIKIEVIDEICDKIQNQQHKHELTGDKRSVAMKSEPEDDWCCESSLYADHQFKDEVVIGPTELHKQSDGLYQHQSILACNICGKIYKHKSSFTRHMNTHNNPAPSVEKREPKLEKQNAMKKEKIVIAKSFITKNKRVYKIDDCKNGEIKSVEFEGKSDNNNLKIKVDNSQNKCLLCFKTFTVPNNLTRHMNQLHGERIDKPYSCDKCSMSFARSDYLIRHKLIKHAEGKQIKFCKCGNKFYDKWSYKRHKNGYCVLKSSTPAKLICDYCKKTFCNKYRLTEHIKKHVNNTYRTLICDYCNKHFHRKFEIERHILQHLGVNLHKFKCRICNKKFTRNWGLKKHLISHTGKKPFSCKYCLRSFGSKWGCVCHERRCRPM